MLSFDLTVSALAESIIRERCETAGKVRSDITESVANYLSGQHVRMPDYLRFPIKTLTCIFDLWSVPSTGRFFHSLPHERRLNQIDAWRRSSLGFRRDLIRFYESLAIFGCYSEAYPDDIG